MYTQNNNLKQPSDEKHEMIRSQTSHVWFLVLVSSQSLQVHCLRLNLKSMKLSIGSKPAPQENDLIE